MDSGFISDHGPILLGVSGAVLLLAALKSRSGVSFPAGMGAAIANSPAPYSGGGTVQASSAAADAQIQMQLSQQQYQQQILLLNAQTHAQILAGQAQADQQQQLLVAQQNAAIQSGHAQMLDNVALLNHEAQVKNNPFAGCQGLGCIGTGLGVGANIAGKLFGL